jgi:hypothetical protein
MKYFLVPNAHDGNSIPTTPEPMTASELGEHLAERLKLMEAQGYWRDCYGEMISLLDITYTIEPHIPYEE